MAKYSYIYYIRVYKYIVNVCGLHETSEGRGSCLSISPLSGSPVSSVSIKPDTPVGFFFYALQLSYQ